MRRLFGQDKETREARLRLLGEELWSAAASRDPAAAQQILNENRSCVKALVNFKHNILGSTPLHMASREGHTAVINLLLRNKAPVDAKDYDGNTPLALASRLGHVQAVDLLVKNRAQVDAKDNMGETPLASAAKMGHVQVMELLLRHRASVDATNSFGYTPLSWAIHEGQVEAMELLILNHAHLEARHSITGFTPLILASFNGKAEAVRVLLRHGARPDILCDAKRAPLDWALEQGHDEVVQLLRKHQASLEAKTESKNMDQVPKHNRNAEIEHLIEVGDWEAVGALAALRIAYKSDDENEDESEHQRRLKIRQEVMELVRQVVPEEVNQVDEMMDQFQGREEELLETLRTMQERAVAQKARMSTPKAPKARKSVHNAEAGSQVDKDKLLNNASHVQNKIMHDNAPVHASNGKVPRPNAALPESTRKQADSSREALRQALQNPNHSGIVLLTPEYVQLCLDYFTPHHALGEGGFGKVFKGHDPELNLDMAIKKVPLRILAEEDLKQVHNSFRREIEALKRYRHPNIVIMYGYNIQLNATENFLMYEYVTKGSLDKYLRDDEGRVVLSGAHRRLNILFEIVQAVHFLHTGGCGGFKVMHRDLKPGNVCLTANFSAKLIDCGVAKFVPTRTSSGGIGSLEPTLIRSSHGAKFGTPLYMCPAYAMDDTSYVAACDIYSIGVMMVEMIVGCLQGGISSRRGADFGKNFAHRYVGKNLKPVSDGWKILVKDADVDIFEWDEEALVRVSMAAIHCMSPDPDERLSSAKLLEVLSKAIELQFNADNPVSDEIPPLPLTVKQKSRWDNLLTMQSAGSIACVLCNQYLNGLQCGQKHSICSPCISELIMRGAGQLSYVRCPIDGCTSLPFRDDELYGKVKLRAFEVYLGCRNGQQEMMAMLEKLLNVQQRIEIANQQRHGEIINGQKVILGNIVQVDMLLGKMAREIPRGMQRCLCAMAVFSSQTFSQCPSMIWLKAAPGSFHSKNPLEWANFTLRRKFLVYFLCQHSFTVIEPPMEVLVPRTWLVKVAPVLRICLCFIKAAATAYAIPLALDISSLLDSAILFANALLEGLDDRTKKSLDSLESEFCETGQLHNVCSDACTRVLLGKAYDFVAKIANEPKNRKWKELMIPVINSDGTPIWIKKEYKEKYVI